MQINTQFIVQWNVQTEKGSKAKSLRYLEHNFLVVSASAGPQTAACPYIYLETCRAAPEEYSQIYQQDNFSLTLEPCRLYF